MALFSPFKLLQSGAKKGQIVFFSASVGHNWSCTRARETIYGNRTINFTGWRDKIRFLISLHQKQHNFMSSNILAGKGEGGKGGETQRTFYT